MQHVTCFHNITSSAKILESKRDSILRDPLRVNKRKILATIVDWLVFVSCIAM